MIPPVLVTCCNDGKNGGVYAWNPNKNHLKRVYPIDCMGITFFNDHYVVASESVNRRHKKSSRHKLSSKRYVPHSLVCLDKNFNIVSETPVSCFGMGDLHDILVFEDKLWVVDTFGNRVIAFSTTRFKTKGAVDFGSFQYIRPVLEWRDPVAQEPDSSHVSGLCFNERRVWVSVFGRFSNNRGYEMRGNEGYILDITDQLQPYGSSPLDIDTPIIKDNLSDPHSLIWHQGDFYFTESRKRRVIKNGEELVDFEEGYIRGLAIVGDTLMVGISRSRHSMDFQNNHCKIACVSLTIGRRIGIIDIPAKEVYTILPNPW